jgi:hypothetical protein
LRYKNKNEAIEAKQMTQITRTRIRTRENTIDFVSLITIEASVRAVVDVNGLASSTFVEAWVFVTTVFVVFGASVDAIVVVKMASMLSHFSFLMLITTQSFGSISMNLNLITHLKASPFKTVILLPTENL